MNTVNDVVFYDTWPRGGIFLWNGEELFKVIIKAVLRMFKLGIQGEEISI